MPYMITIKYKLITLNPLYMQIYYGAFNFAHHVNFDILCYPIPLSYRPCEIVHINICA